MMRKYVRSFVAVLLAVWFFSSTSTLACGPIALEAVFVHTVHPTFPIERFAAGRVGVLQPSYARSYLYVAYRYLNGSGFTPAEQRSLTKFWQERLNYSWSSAEEDWTKAWLETRRKVVSQDPAAISVYRNREKPNEYESYLNCQKDAFDTAIATLNERIAKYGPDSPVMKTWVAAQDQVFSNCGSGNVIPEQLPSDADALMRADRAYQIAAANFYAGNHDEAQKAFETIAVDDSSPWQRNAVYLIARTLIRKGSLGPAEQKQESLSAAEGQLQKILGDKKLSSLQPASTRLLNLVRLRLHPAERLNELARILTAKTENQNLKQDLWDYTALLDGYLEEDESETPKSTEVPKTEDLTDWIATFQDSGAGIKEHALERWQTTHANAWLVASLAAHAGKDPKSSELIAQARKVPSSSAAFASARFHAIRLLMESEQDAEARTLLDQTLKSERAHFDESSLNLLIGRRMLLANSLAEFLIDATRIPAALSWDDDGREVPTNDEETTAEAKTQRGKPLFDVDAAHALNQQLPLSLLKEAVKSDVLPAGPRRDLAQAAWLRAALLSDTTTADELVPVLSKLVPEISELLNNYSSTTPPDEKKFAAIHTWLKAPGLEPVVDAGLGRETPLQQQDSYRDNWWCSSYLPPPADEAENREVVEFTAPANAAPPLFLTPSEVERGAKEWSALKALGTAPNYIVRQVIQWANSHPQDPRVPEALHLAVKTTRFGCTDKDSSRWSKAAFDLLHRKYPTSPWTKKTPYWFKD